MINDKYIIKEQDTKVYEVIFYQDSKGYSELFEFIETLNKKAASSKNERIMLKQIRFYINVLENLGTRAGESFVKHIQDEVWELRAGINRILFFAEYQMQNFSS